MNAVVTKQGIAGQLRLLVWLCGLGGLGTSLYYALHPAADFDFAIWPMLLTTCLSVGAYVGMVAYVHSRLVLTPPICVLLTMSAWHLAFIAIYAAGGASDFRTRFVLEIAREANVKGLAICTGGIVAFLLGLMVPRRDARLFPDQPEATESLALLRRFLSWFQVLGLVAIWAYFLLQGRKTIGDYSAVFVENQPLRQWYNMGVMLTLGTLGPALFLAQSRGERAKLTLLALAAAAPSVLMGSRWVFFSTIIVAASVWSVTGWRIRPFRVALVGLLILGGSILIKEIRAGKEVRINSVSEILMDRHTFFIAEFFEEIGTALTSCILTVELHDYYRTELRGRSYLEALLTVVPGMGLASRQNTPDHLIAGQYFPDRYNSEGFTIGYSVIAEWYLNFGLVGVYVGQFVAGLTLARMWIRATTGSLWWVIVSYVCLTFLIFGTRSDFFTWVRPFGRSLFLIAAVYLLCLRRQRPQPLAVETPNHGRRR